MIAHIHTFLQPGLMKIGTLLKLDIAPMQGLARRDHHKLHNRSRDSK
jgi:hypothetical protein